MMSEPPSGDKIKGPGTTRLRGGLQGYPTGKAGRAGTTTLRRILAATLANHDALGAE